MTDQENKYSYLEGLRGIMALIVVISHFIFLFSPVTSLGSFELHDFQTKSRSFNILLATTPLNIFMSGNWAVCIFFILSGYVLSLAYFKKRDTQILQASAFKRYFRLAIPILAACLLIYILHITGIFSKVYYPRHLDEFSFGKPLFINTISLLQTIKMALLNVPFKGDSTLLPVLWTLQLEFTGALLLFSFLLVTHNANKKWAWYIFMIAILFILEHNYLTLFFAGSFIALYQERIKAIFKNNFLRALLLLAGLFFAGIPNIEDRAKSCTMYFFTVGAPYIIFIYFHVVSAILLFMFIVSAGISQKILSARPLIFLGRISFSLYLLHLPVLFITGSTILKASRGNINYYLLFLICLITCLGLSYVFYRLVDLNSVRFSNKIAGFFLKPQQNTTKD